jgi:TetR/AcrR family transcriptional regulator
MADTNPTRPQTDRADQTRARILDAAISEFSSNGLAGARTERIAGAAGVNKALLYYYFRSKEELYEAALEAVVETVRESSFAVLESEAAAGEKFLRIALNHFDRIYSKREFQSLMQQEMVRLHRGESNALGPIAIKFMRPLWARVKEVVEEGIATGELISVEWTQFIYAGLGANIFYFLSAPMTKIAQGTDPLEPGALKFRRKAAIEYLGQSIFIDRSRGARIAAGVLADTLMPKLIAPPEEQFAKVKLEEPKNAKRKTRKRNIEIAQTSSVEVRLK